MISWFCNTNPHDSNPAKSGTIRRKSRWWGWYLKIVSWPSITDLVWSLQGLGWGVGVERLVGSQGRAPQKEEMGYLWKWKPKMNPDLWPALTAHPNHPHLPAYCPNHVLVIARRLKSNICNQPGLGDKRECVRISMFTKHCPREILVSATGSLGLNMSWMKCPFKLLGPGCCLWLRNYQTALSSGFQEPGGGERGTPGGKHWCSGSWGIMDACSIPSYKWVLCWLHYFELVFRGLNASQWKLIKIKFGKLQNRTKLNSDSTREQTLGEATVN